MCFLTIYVFTISLKSIVHKMFWHLANQTGQKRDIIFSYHLNHRLLFITIERADYIYRMEWVSILGGCDVARQKGPRRDKPGTTEGL